MHRIQLVFVLLSLTALSAAPATADTQSAMYPWQLLSGGYDSSVNDGRILGYPQPAVPLGPGFFNLVENSIMTMTADNGGFSRSAAPWPCGGLPWYLLLTCALAPQGAGDRWENSNGGRGFTNSYCGGYGDDCAGLASATLGAILAGPPSVMDNALPNYSPNDIASGGWPDSLLDWVRNTNGAGFPICIAPAGLPDAQVNDCAPGMTYRTGLTHLFASPDAGRQWYPFASSCGLAWEAGADYIAVDPGLPGHIVTARAAEASGCTGENQAPPPACAQRRIAWTLDVSSQIQKSIEATASDATDTTHAVDLAGGEDTSNPHAGWRYAALGHLALSNQNGVCDVAHAGIQANCQAEATDPANKYCHAVEAPADASHERFCPKYSQADGACKCGYLDADIKLQPVNAANCAFPEVASLAIDPRNGQVYAPSNTGLLFSPDGGRKWRRHGHSPFTPWGATAGTSPTTEPWPYADLPPGGLDEVNDPGVKIVTMQGLPDSILNALIASGGPEFAALDLNAQPTLLRHMSRISFATQPCPSTSAMPENPFIDPMGFPRPRGEVVATLAASWVNPLNAEQVLAGVFVAHGDSCTDAAGKAPLVFWDTANAHATNADAQAPAARSGVTRS